MCVFSHQAKLKGERNRQKAEEAFLKQVHSQRQEMAQQRREEKRRAEKERIMNEEDPDRARKLEVRGRLLFLIWTYAADFQFCCCEGHSKLGTVYLSTQWASISFCVCPNCLPWPLFVGKILKNRHISFQSKCHHMCCGNRASPCYRIGASVSHWHICS